MNCLSRRADADVPIPPQFPSRGVRALRTRALPMPPVAVHVEVLAVAVDTVGIVGSNELGPTLPTVGNTPVIGTAGAELTPRLLISIEPNGIPVRAAPPGVVGDIDVDVGVDDEAMLLEPEPHIPDIPDVSSIPEDVDIPDGIVICDDVDVPVVAMGSVVAAVAGALLSRAGPPPVDVTAGPYGPAGAISPGVHTLP